MPAIEIDWICLCKITFCLALFIIFLISFIFNYGINEEQRGMCSMLYRDSILGRISV